MNETAGVQAMDSNRIRTGLDVYHHEPGTGLHPLVSKLACHRRVCDTHHIGTSTEPVQAAVADG